MTDHTQTTNQRKAKQPAPSPQQGGHSARQDPLNTTIRQQTEQNTTKARSE